MAELNGSGVKSYSDLNKPKSYGGTYAGGGTSGSNPLSQALYGGGTRGSVPTGPTYGGGTRSNIGAPSKNSSSYGGGTRSFIDNPVNQARQEQDAQRSRNRDFTGGVGRRDSSAGGIDPNAFLSGIGNAVGKVGQAFDILSAQNAQAQAVPPTPSFSPFNYGGFNYNGPSVDDILNNLLEQYGGVFDQQEQGLTDRKAQALAAIEQSYKGLQGDLKDSQGSVDERYEAQQAEMDKNAEQAQGAISAGDEDTQARQAALAKVLGTEDAVNNDAANEDAAYYAARAAANDEAAQNNVSAAQTRDFNANQNAITTAGFAAPEMQYQSRQNYDAALDELGTARNQFQQAAYQNALNQYNQDRSNQMQEWQLGRDSAYQNWAAENQFNQNQADRMWQEQQSEADRDFQAQQQIYQAEAEAANAASQPPDLSDMTNEEQLLQRLQQAGVTPGGSTRWYNELLDQVSNMPAGQLTPQMITGAHQGSSQAESYLVDYARKMGWL